VPEVICGASVGAIVGGAYAAGTIDAFESWVRGLDRARVLRNLDLSLRGGLLKGAQFFSFMAPELPDRDIASLPKRFAAVAADLETGREIWLRDGSLHDALRASAAMPGLIAPVVREGRWLVDGGLVNPVPVSLCRAMGADTVLAVDLNTTLLGRRFSRDQPDAKTEAKESGSSSPSIYEVLANSLNIMQVRITRSRMAGDPPDLLITPRMADFGLLDLDRGAEAIEEGRRATEWALAAASRATGQDSQQGEST
jgi:NTE family protein